MLRTDSKGLDQYCSYEPPRYIGYQHYIGRAFKRKVRAAVLEQLDLGTESKAWSLILGTGTDSVGSRRPQSIPEIQTVFQNMGVLDYTSLV